MEAISWFETLVTVGFFGLCELSGIVNNTFLMTFYPSSDDGIGDHCPFGPDTKR
jgi:hypothetical protein